MDRHIIALDIGTTNVKAGLLDEHGTIRRLLKTPSPLEGSDKGSFYRPETLWSIVSGQIGQLLKETEKEVAGISVTGMAEAGLILDRTSGAALTEILPWFDPRPQELSKMEDREKEREIFRSTGLWNSYKYGVYKYLWLLKERRLDKEKTIWLSVCDYIVYRLTGEMVTDPTFAARTYLFQADRRCWDLERMEALGLSETNFPKVAASGKSVGTYQGIPVALAGHDHICAAFGLLYQDRNGICDSAGTSETYVGRLDREALTGGFLPDSGLLYGPFVDEGFFYMANVPSSGHSVEWFRKKIQLQEISYDEMNRALSQREKGPGELLYFPYLTGMGAPWYRPDIRGMFLGLRETDEWTDLLQGIIEGVQYQARWLLQLVERMHGIRSDTVVCAGGSVHNAFMMQTKADVLNREIRIPELTEATICGAAALFLKKNYGETSAEKFLETPVRIRKIYRPEKKMAGEYRKIFETRYLPLIEVLEKYNLQ